MRTFFLKYETAFQLATALFLGAAFLLILLALAEASASYFFAAVVSLSVAGGICWYANHIGRFR